jgi:hypothetical protein
LNEVSRSFDRHREPQLFIAQADAVSGVPALLHVLAMADKHESIAQRNFVEQNNSRKINGLMAGKNKSPLAAYSGPDDVSYLFHYCGINLRWMLDA